jgi:hypothetical protein
VSGFRRAQFYHPSAKGVADSAIYRGQYEFVEAIQRVADGVPRALTQRLGALSMPHDLDQIHAEIAAWQSKYGLIDPWILDIVIDVYQWGGPAAELWLRHRFYGPRPLSVEPHWAKGVPSGQFTFEHPGLNLAHDGTIGDLTRQLRRAFDATLRTFLTDVRERAYDEGWKDIPSHRRPAAIKRASDPKPSASPQSGADGRAETRSYDWLALFQCLRWSAARIAKQHALEAHTVAEAVTSTAQVIGLTLRTGRKHGRPRRTDGNR